MNKKYPRTFHLPWSPGRTRDDLIMPDISHLLGKTLVVTEKMDGSNVCLESNGVFARSHNGPPKHPSFDALKSFYHSISYKIPDDTQVFGEWLYTKHSIHYTNLPHYLMLFGVRYEGEWLPWDEVKMWAKDLGVSTVPVLGYCVVPVLGYKEALKDFQEILNKFITRKSIYSEEKEGLVVRLNDAFLNHEFSACVGKWVRENHIQTDQHWSHQSIVKNLLKSS